MGAVGMNEVIGETFGIVAEWLSVNRMFRAV